VAYLAEVAHRGVVRALVGAVAVFLSGMPMDAVADGRSDPRVSLKDSGYSAPASWAGFYVGANLGYQWGAGHSSMSLEPSRAAWTAISPAFGFFDGRYGDSPSGFLGGAQLGINWQSGTVVFGAEADIDWLDADETSVRSADVPLFFPARGAVRQELDWLGTVRGRLGLLVNPDQSLLVYATGGLAFGRVNTSHEFGRVDTPALVGFGASSSETEFGWTVGAGGELRLDRNWSIKGEYLYYDLGDQNVVGAPVNQAPNGFGADAHYETSGHIVRFGVNYRVPSL
jgi:outer membrane immunogenic protein